MQIIIRNTTDQPIYEQICEQIKRQILSGALAPGEALPSIRGLAKDLKISVITTKRAYDELEAEGLLHNVPGKGCYVALSEPGALRERRTQELREHLAAAVELCRACGVGQAELTALLQTLYEEESP